MSEKLEEHIRLLLAGQNLNEDTYIAHSVQHEADGGKNIYTTTDTNYVPICQKTVTYIVAAVVVNDKNEVLMMQEAKASCSGKWYLPAGRVERNENLIDAVKREVLEETGLIIEPKTLILVECASGSWFRFVFTGDISGGNIKTSDEANEESLQARWVHNVEDLPLRSNDIIPLIERGRNYIQNKTGLQHPYIMPLSKPLSKLLLQLIITAKKRATNKLHMVTLDTGLLHLPVCEINPNRSLLSTLHNFMTEIFGTDVAPHKPHGLLMVEFSGNHDGDGLCLTLLVSFKLPVEEVPIIGKYSWYQASEDIAEAITTRLPRNMTVPLNVNSLEVFLDDYVSLRDVLAQLMMFDSHF
ncbi:PREDICTED: 8-oxo-dGDP phosphatase NUDT18 isoform X2 [Polistes dominula]|uniref:8-oxo-dGDP phosphatase NUDT18 isoform X2 n=1 Tax=Polistes dominula TaxID=743375 RepID=A0ABM1I5M0_POLDO|nr:PREDICTED: 8-oxo-dGDP phosphatase NUDT18 isoform X2 [Polistes dominula]